MTRPQARHLDRLLLIRRIRPWVQSPKGYGVAWLDYCRDETVVAPLGLNRLYGWANMAYWWIKRPSRLFKHRRIIEKLERENEMLRRELREERDKSCGLM